jgi:ABC-2 type transport system ATP-binding protein
MAAIEVAELTKTYGPLTAVDSVTFEVAEGEVFALLGPNGAGKSTTIEILEGHRRATSGRARVLGIDPDDGGRELRDRIGIVLQSSGIESALSVREAVELHRSSYRNPRSADEVIELVGLGAKQHDRVKTLSGGQQRRIDLTLGLVGNPEVLFLDEPTTGFDPSARRGSWELLAGLRELGTTIILTTHYMDEAEQLADRVGVIVGGRIVAIGTPDELSAGTDLTTVAFRVPTGVEWSSLPRLTAEPRVSGRLVEVRTASPTADLHRLAGWAIDGGFELVDLSVHRPSLEDVYLSLTEPAATDVAVST